MVGDDSGCRCRKGGKGKGGGERGRLWRGLVGGWVVVVVTPPSLMEEFSQLMTCP